MLTLLPLCRWRSCRRFGGAPLHLHPLVLLGRWLLLLLMLLCCPIAALLGFRWLLPGAARS
jgi:hypothetical protein